MPQDWTVGWLWWLAVVPTCGDGFEVEHVGHCWTGWPVTGHSHGLPLPLALGALTGPVPSRWPHSPAVSHCSDRGHSRIIRWWGRGGSNGGPWWVHGGAVVGAMGGVPVYGFEPSSCTTRVVLCLAVRVPRSRSAGDMAMTGAGVAGDCRGHDPAPGPLRRFGKFTTLFRGRSVHLSRAVRPRCAGSWP